MVIAKVADKCFFIYSGPNKIESKLNQNYSQHVYYCIFIEKLIIIVSALMLAQY